MTNSEILVGPKILLECRAYTKKELNSILDKMVEGCVPQKNMKLVSNLLVNEKYHYVELDYKSGTKDKLWKLGENIKECKRKIRLPSLKRKCKERRIVMWLLSHGSNVEVLRPESLRQEMKQKLLEMLD